MVAIFPKLCFWRRSLCSNLRGIDPEKLYRATLIMEKNQRWALESSSFIYSASVSPQPLNRILHLNEK